MVTHLPLYCPCGSGKPFIGTEHDGHGIYLFRYCCDDCYDHQLKRFRDDIFERYECDEPIDED
jgi:hypothetical protein